MNGSLTGNERLIHHNVVSTDGVKIDICITVGTNICEVVFVILSNSVTHFPLKSQHVVLYLPRETQLHGPRLELR